MEAGTAEVCIAPAQAGQRLDRALAAALPALSRARLQALIAAGHVSAAGRAMDDPARKVRLNEVYRVVVPPAEPAVPQAQAIPLAVVYEDDDVIVIDKPVGLVVHPAPGSPDLTLVNALLAHCGDTLSGIGGVRRPGIVHRIDKDTSGLLVAAKHDAAHAGLAAQFATHDIHRVYNALVWGLPSPLEDRIEGPIGRDPANRKRMTITAGGKAAATRYRVRRAFGTGAALVHCRLETGRTHQIRVHMASRGHPLIGDTLYGRPTPARRAALGPAGAVAAGFGRQALHAAELGFRHPIKGVPLSFTSPLPNDLSLLIRNLESVEVGGRELDIAHTR